MKILNLYAGIGGNRKNWDGRKHDITAVEKNPEIAQTYRDHFHTTDKVVETDAHKYLRENHEKYDFIWASPPCHTHSTMRKSGSKAGQYEPKYPDMKLWQEILFLDTYFEGKWVVENVKPFYDEEVEWEVVEPVQQCNHYFWSNFAIPRVGLPTQQHNDGNIEKWQEYYGFNLNRYNYESVEKRQVLRNCVHPKLGEAILKSANKKQQKLSQVTAQ